jgi:glycerol-3-phosphate acyltransferase PlsY
MLLLLVIVIGYLLGSLPMGVIYVRLFTGQDVREVGSGRTGSTNVMRAAGGKIALLTGLSDGLKAALAVWVAHWLVPHTPWAEVLAGLAAILGHNYSIFIGFRGGAGGGPTVGAATALWWVSLFIIAPIGALVWYFVGYASVTTISFAITAILIMAVRYALGLAPIEYVYFGVLALLLCLWSLRPNLKRLAEGTERLHGYRAKKKPHEQAPQA